MDNRPSIYSGSTIASSLSLPDTGTQSRSAYPKSPIHRVNDLNRIGVRKEQSGFYKSFNPLFIGSMISIRAEMFEGNPFWWEFQSPIHRVNDLNI